MRYNNMKRCISNCSVINNFSISDYFKPRKGMKSKPYNDIECISDYVDDPLDTILRFRYSNYKSFTFYNNFIVNANKYMSMYKGNNNE